MTPYSRLLESDDGDDEDVSMGEASDEDDEGSAEDWDEMESRLAKEDKQKKLKRKKKGLDFVYSVSQFSHTYEKIS